MKKLFILLVILLGLGASQSSAQAQTVNITRIRFTNGPCEWIVGTGAPNNVVIGNVCDWYEQVDAVSQVQRLWTKESGTGTNTGWVAAFGGSGGGGAPIDATYITQTSNATLTNEQAMGLLGTGLVLNTTTTGVQSIFGGATCTNQVIGVLSASGAATCRTITSSYVDNTLALTGTDINTSNQVTATHLVAALPIAQGGTGNTSGTATINANLTGPITSVGNATSIASQTGTGTTFAMSAGPTFTGVPAAPTAAGGTNTTQLATTAFVQTAVSGGGVTSITGTANQITASASTGAVTLSIPATLVVTTSAQANALKIPTTTSSTVGVILHNSVPFLHGWFDATSNGQNTFIGDSAGNFSMGPSGGAASLASMNVGIGAYALRSNTTGYQNVAIGTYTGAEGSMNANTTGFNNVAVGSRTLKSNTTGNNNLAIGFQALTANISGTANVAIGNSTLTTVATTSSNIGIGGSALNSTSGSHNVGIGASSLGTTLGADDNVGIGYLAGLTNQTGAQNVWIGATSDASNTAWSNSIGIGYGVTTTKSNQTILGNTSITETLLNGKTGISVTGPTAILHLKAGTATANTAPLKFNSGTLLTTAEAGVMEFLTDQPYFTITTGAARKGYMLDDGARLTSGNIPVATTNGRLIDGPVQTAVPVVSNHGRSTAQTAAVTSVVAFTVGAADTSFTVSSNVNVTTSTLHSFSVTCAYTDEGNTSRVLTLPFVQLGGITLVGTITNTTGVGPYEGVPLHIRAKSGTTVTVATSGTFTTVTYNVEGYITQIGT